MTASSVLPAAMAAAVASGTGVPAFARKAPAAIPGHARRPSTIRAARARPVGGHTSEMLWPMEAYRRPSRAAA